MGYDIDIVNKKNKKVVHLSHKISEQNYPKIEIEDYGLLHNLKIGPELSFGVTYNYSDFLYKKSMFGKKGIRSLYGITLDKAQNKICKCINVLNMANPNDKEWIVDYSDCKEKPTGYWICNIDNVRKTLICMNDMINVMKIQSPKNWNTEYCFKGD